MLTYAKGNCGFRIIFEKAEGGNRAAMLQELTNWPTYYPSYLSKDEIVDEMLTHYRSMSGSASDL